MTPAKGQHTPGPWSYDGHGINSIAESHKGERILKTCLDYSYGSVDRERAIADSHLAAASPMLLEALREATFSLEWVVIHDGQIEHVERLRAAKAAIRAAEGE